MTLELLLVNYSVQVSPLSFVSIDDEEESLLSSLVLLEAERIFVSMILYTKAIALREANKPAGMNFFDTKNFFPMTKPSIPDTENPSMFPVEVLLSEDLDIIKAESNNKPPNVDPAMRLALLPLTNPINPPAKVSPPTTVLRTMPLGEESTMSVLLPARREESNLLSRFRGVINRFFVVFENPTCRSSNAIVCRASSIAIPRRYAGLKTVRKFIGSNR